MKKSICLFLILAIVLSASSCSKKKKTYGSMMEADPDAVWVYTDSDGSSYTFSNGTTTIPVNDANTSEEYISFTSFDDPTSPPTPGDETNSTLTPDINLAGANIVDAADFSEDRAWVCTIPSEGKNMWSLVDRNGISYYDCSYKRIVSGGVISQTCKIGVNPIKDGVCYVSFYGNADPEQDCEIIIDKNGNELYRTKQQSSSNQEKYEHIVAYGDRKFIVVRSESGFSGTTFTIGSIDQNGKELSSFQSIDFPADYFKEIYTLYYGDGLFYVGNDYLFDANTNSLHVIAAGNIKNLNKIVDGKFYYRDIQIGWDHFYIYDIIRGRNIDLREPGQKYTDISFYARREEFLFPSGSGDAYYAHGFNNLNGERVLDISQYSEYPMWCSSFNDEGYSIMVIIGKDENAYCTVIDKAGNEQFQLMRIDYDGTNRDKWFSISNIIANGKFACVIDNELCLFDIHGNKIDTIFTWHDSEKGPSIYIDQTSDNCIRYHYYSDRSQVIYPCSYGFYFF